MEVVLVLIHLAIVVWVFIDAGRRTPTGWTWGLLTLISSLAGLLVYLGVRPLFEDVDRYGSRLYRLERQAGGPGA